MRMSAAKMSLRPLTSGQPGGDPNLKHHHHMSLSRKKITGKRLKGNLICTFGLENSRNSINVI
jgi:hypothetical protein